VTDDAEDETSTSESESESGAEEVQQTEEMLLTNEMATTLERATNQDVSIDNVIVEINSIKHAYGIQIRELNGLLFLLFDYGHMDMVKDMEAHHVSARTKFTATRTTNCK